MLLQALACVPLDRCSGKCHGRGRAGGIISVSRPARRAKELYSISKLKCCTAARGSRAVRPEGVDEIYLRRKRWRERFKIHLLQANRCSIDEKTPGSKAGCGIRGKLPRRPDADLLPRLVGEEQVAVGFAEKIQIAGQGHVAAAVLLNLLKPPFFPPAQGL